MKASFLWVCVSSLTELQIKVSQGWGVYRRSLQHWLSSLQHDCLFPCLLLSRFFPPMSWFLRWCLMLVPLSVWLIFVVGEGRACTDKQTGFCPYLDGQRGPEDHFYQGKCWRNFQLLTVVPSKPGRCPSTPAALRVPRRHNSSTASRHCSSWAPATSQQHLFQNKGPSSCLK